MNGKSGGTHIISHVMDLCEHQSPNVTINVKDEDAALISAEERMLEDEEMESIDEGGHPMMEVTTIENQNVAFVMNNGASERKEGDPSNVIPMDGNCAEFADTYQSHKSTDHNTSVTLAANPTFESTIDTTSMTERANATSQNLVTTRSHTQISNPSLRKVVPPMKPKPLPPPPPTLHNTTKVNLVTSNAAIPTVHTSHGVPNPLASLSTPLKSESSDDLQCSSSQVTISSSVPLSKMTEVPCPLPPISCSLGWPPSGGNKDSVTFLNTNNVTEQYDSSKLEFSSSDLLPKQRGRIFSMDFDAGGLDFPDMSVEILVSEFTDSPELPPLPGPHSHRIESSTRSCDPPIPMSVPSSGVFSGRDRAMSFEFFSLGFNADEPLPATTVVSEDGFGFQHQQQRPRGESIIFDPVSFQDGGIHDEKAFFRSSRANSIDMPSKDEIAIMNAPGFMSPSLSCSPHKSKDDTAVQQKSIPSNNFHPNSQDQQSSMTMKNTTTTTTTTSANRTTNNMSDSMATTSVAASSSSSTPVAVSSSSSLINGSMNHATLQMELLNKDGRIGIYLPDARRARIAKFHSKRKMRIWRKRIKYDCRKKLADSRPRIKGRFVKRVDMDDEDYITMG